MSAAAPASPDPLQEEFFLTDAARMRRWLPWLHLPSVVRLAFDPRKLFLTMLALGLLATPGLLRQRFAPHSVTALAPLPWESGYLFQDTGDPVPPAAIMLANPLVPLRYATTQGPQLLTPVAQVFDQGRALIEQPFHWGATSIGIVQLLWTWAVWAVFGTLICRLAALDFLGRDVGWSEAWWFCRGRVVSSFAAPLLPLLGIVGLWLPCVVAGWITRVPAVGQPVVAVGWVFVWFCGGGMALLLLGLTLTWPLMIATVGVEGTDAFDGLSRSYNYLFSRPWYVLWMVGMSLLLGGGGLFVVRWFAENAEWLAIRSLAVGATGPTVDAFHPGANITGSSGAILQFWRQAIQMGVHAFACSFYWSAITVMFLLLRKSVDATPLDQLTTDRTYGSGTLPLAGIPAAERREQATPPQR